MEKISTSNIVKSLELLENGIRVAIHNIDGWFLKKEKGRCYRVEYHHPTTNIFYRKSLKTNDFYVALEKAKEYYKDVAIQSYIGVVREKSFSQVANEYMSSYGVPKYNIDTIKRHLLPFFTQKLEDANKSQKIHLLETDDIRKYQKWRESTGQVSKNTISRECCVISKMLAFAKEKGYLSKDSNIKVPYVPTTYNARQAFKAKELKEIFKKAEANWLYTTHTKIREDRRVLYFYIRFLYETGMRCGDALKLSWREIFLEEQFPFYVIKSKQNKTKINKQIPLPWDTMAMLCDLKTYQRDFCKKYNIRFTDDMPVFGKCQFFNRQAKVVHPKSFKKSFQNLLKSCSFYDEDTCKNKITRYSFRHSTATAYRLDGFSNEEVAELLSTSPRMISKIYDKSTLVGRYAKKMEEKMLLKQSIPYQESVEYLG